MVIGTMLPGLKEQHWAALVFLWLSTSLLLGGISVQQPGIIAFQSISSGAMILLALARLRHGLPTAFAASGLAIAALAIGWGLLQLVPLPMSVWQSLPARGIMLEGYRLTGGLPDSLPLTLSPEGTRGALLVTLVPLAGFLAALSLPQRYFVAISASIFACGLIGVSIGLAQRFLGAASGLYFYESAGNLAVGTFNNRNFFATQLFTSIPLFAALVMALRVWRRFDGIVLGIFSIAYVSMVIAGLTASGSRSGLVLCLSAILATTLLVFRLKNQEAKKAKLSKIIAVVVVSLFVVSQAGMVALLRFVEPAAKSDIRSTIYAVTYDAAWAFFPWGSGFGSYVPAYQLFEKPETITDAYANAAHNDWLQAWMEGGAPALIIMVLFLVWYFAATYKSLRLPGHLVETAHIRAAAIAIALMLLHAFVDFPLHIPGLLAVLGACCGLLAHAGSPAQASRKHHQDFGSRGATSSDETRPRFKQASGFPPPGRRRKS